jgi:NAD(P)-dependent dehydrogenase (short-subunit alcohol dehydrogenase family)
MSLQDRTVLVIGRGSGIARAVVSAVRAQGAKVVVAGRNTDTLAAAYSDPGVSVEYIDLTDEPSIAALAERLGRVDHVVSTGSARARGLVTDLDPTIVTLSFTTKVVGPILLAKHFGPRLAKDGSIVLLSGSTALKPTAGMLAVGATNAAVNALARMLAVELAPIRVNAISPGTIDSGAYDGLGEQRKAELFAARTEHNPAGRIGYPGDIASAVVFALDNTFLTGTSINVDGGEPLV